MTEKLEVGDFVRNTIHGYIAFLFGRDSNEILFNVIIVSTADKADYWQKLNIGLEGHWRREVPTELEKVLASLSLIAKTKKHLEKLNLDGNLDNLNYIEFVSQLNEKEKALKNENKL